MVLNAPAQSVGGTISGGIKLCPKAVNSGFLALNGYTGIIQKWESSTDGGITWTNTNNTIATQSYDSIKQTTCYRAIVKNGTFAPDTSSIACLTVYAQSMGGIISGGGTFCGVAAAGVLNLTGNTGDIRYWRYSIDNGASWITVVDSTTVLNYAAIIQNTLYKAVVQNGAACPEDTSAQAYFLIDPVSQAGIIAGADSVCYLANKGILNLSGNVGTIVSWLSSTDNGITWTIVPDTTTSGSYKGLTQTTRYAALVKSGICNADTAFFTVNVWMPTPVNAGNDTTIAPGQSITLNGTGAGKPLWSASSSSSLKNDSILRPTVTPASTTTYTLTITDARGCVNSASVRITVAEGQFTGMVSNLITPNGDGINDTWYIQGIQNFTDNEVFVYNIYGMEVYEKKGYTNDWGGTYNGSNLPDGAYYYILKFDKTQQVIKGSLNIIRSR